MFYSSVDMFLYNVKRIAIAIAEFLTCAGVISILGALALYC